MCLPKIRAFSKPSTLLLVIIVAQFCLFSTNAQMPTPTPANDLDSAGTVFSFKWPETREGLTLEAFLAGALPTAPISNEAFLPAGLEIGMGDRLSGSLTLKPQTLTVFPIGTVPPNADGDAAPVFPGATLSFLIQGDRFIPMQDEAMRWGAGTPDRRWTVILGIGRAWQEAGDAGWSRVLIPVSLIEAQETRVWNGLLSFLYDESGKTSSGFLQFAQETAQGREADLIGEISLSLTPGEWAGSDLVLIEFMTGLAKAPDFRDLPAHPPSGLVSDRVSAAGMLVGDVVYMAPCRTRQGPYPFCRQMRHAVGGLSASLFGFTVVAHAAQRFWNGILDASVGGFIPELGLGAPWDTIRVEDLMDHRSGLESAGGPAAPPSVPLLISDILGRARAAEDRAVASGERYRRDLVNDLLLSLTLDRIARSRLGRDRGLLWLAKDRFLRDLGIPDPVLRMIHGDSPGQAIPDIGSGYFPTTDEVARLMMILQQTRRPETRTDLSRALVAEALSVTTSEPHLGFHAQSVTACGPPVPLARDENGSAILFANEELAAFYLTDDGASHGLEDFLARTDFAARFCN